MLPDEILAIMAQIRVAYPNFYKGVQGGDYEAAKNLWYEALSDCDFKITQKAVNKFIMTDKSGFAPTIGQLRGTIEDDIKMQYIEKFFRKAVRKSMGLSFENDGVSGYIGEA